MRSQTTKLLNAVPTLAVGRWLPPGKTAAVCFSIDDIHPGTSEDRYEAGGDRESGALGRLVRLQQRHARLKATLCVTPDWRLESLIPGSGFLRHIPWAKQHVHWARLQSAGRYRLDRHPAFVAYLNSLRRCQIVPHGLMHTHVGPQLAVEFQGQSEQQCCDIVQQGVKIFEHAGLKMVPGYAPPAWNAPPALINALERLDFQFLCSARDLQTPVTAEAVTAMSGLCGVSLIYPQLLGQGRLVHLTCNFQATSSVNRAVRILELGGLLHVKAHIFKSDGRHIMLDGLDDLYCNYLDLLFSDLARRFGDSLWWAHLSEVAQRVRCVS